MHSEVRTVLFGLTPHPPKDRKSYYLAIVELIRVVNVRYLDSHWSPYLLLKNRNFSQELHLEKCRIYLPDVYQHFEKSVVHVNLRRFRFLSDHVSLKWHPFLTRCIAVYMPKLIELEIQPQAASGMWTSNFCRRIVHTKHG